MKKIVILLLTLLMLLGMAACGGTPAAPAGEEVPASGTDAALLAKIQEKTDAKFTFDETTYNMKAEREYLASHGITARIENAVVQSINSCTFDLVLENEDGKALSLPLTGRCFVESKEGDISYYRGEWGGINIPRENVLALCSGGTVTLIDLPTLTVMDFTPALPAGEGQTYYPVGIVWQEGLGYVVPCTDLQASYLLLLDEQGALLRQTTVNGEQDYTPFITYNYNFDNSPAYGTTPEFATIDKQYLKIWSTYYDMETGDYFQLGSVQTVTDGSSRVELFSYSDRSTPNNMVTYAAILYRDDVFSDMLLFRNEEIDSMYEGFTGTIDPTAKTAELYCDTFGMTLSLDFAGQSCTVRHEPQEKHLEEQIAASADGAYSLWSANVISGGDAYIYNIVLRENASGRLTYISPAGGMWGGSSEQGFLRNGEFYVMDPYSLKIYDPSTAECTFDINEHFPLGGVPSEGLQRYLFAFRRDPQDFSFLVVYAEYGDDSNNGKTESKEENGQYYEQLPFHYRIGRLDADGLLVESWDTGKNVIGGFFGLSPINLTLNGDTLTLTGSADKSHGAFSGTFDLKTHTFTDHGFAEN